MGRGGTRWTFEEAEALREALEAGCTWRECAERVGRGWQACYQRAYRDGLRYRAFEHRPWMPSERRALREACETCATWEEVAALLPNRTAQAACSMAQMRGLKLRRGKRPKWMPHEVVTLTRLISEGASHREAARTLGRSTFAVRGYCSKHGILKQGKKEVRHG